MACRKRAAPAAGCSPVPGDFYLLVAQDVHDRDLTQRMFTTTLPWTVALILVLGLSGGALMSRNMLRRLDAINRTSRRDHRRQSHPPRARVRRRTTSSTCWRKISTACWTASSG